MDKQQILMERKLRFKREMKRWYKTVSPSLFFFFFPSYFESYDTSIYPTYVILALQVVAKVSNLYPKDMEVPANGIDDMTKLSYLHEPGVLHNLAARFEINEIYVRSSCSTCSVESINV